MTQAAAEADEILICEGDHGHFRIGPLGDDGHAMRPAKSEKVRATVVRAGAGKRLEAGRDRPTAIRRITSTPEKAPPGDRQLASLL